MASQVNKVRNALSDGKPFLTKENWIRPSWWISRDWMQNQPAESGNFYTVEDLLELKDNGLWDEFQDAIWNADNGIL